MGFSDEHPVEAAAVRRGPGRPRVSQAAPAVPVATRHQDPEKRYRVTLREVDGGHQGPVPLHSGGHKNGRPHDERAVLLPDVPQVISASLLARLKGAVVDERGPDFEKNQAALARGEAPPPTMYDKDGRVVAPGGHLTGRVKQRFLYDVEEV